MHCHRQSISVTLTYARCLAWICVAETSLHLYFFHDNYKYSVIIMFIYDYVCLSYILTYVTLHHEMCINVPSLLLQ